MSNLGTVNGNLNSGIWPMPEPATMSQADGAINMAGIIKGKSGVNDGNMISQDGVPAGGNDGTVVDGLPTDDASSRI